MILKIVKIVNFIIAVLILIAAVLSLCHIIPTVPGIIISLGLILCNFMIEAVLAYKRGSKLTMISYLAASCGLAVVVVYSVFA